jgi:hypothetical protein
MGTEGSADSSTLRQLFLRTHTGMLQTTGVRESPRRSPFIKVIATELAGLVEKPDQGIPLSEIGDSKILSWLRLASLTDALCVCSNLGTAIRPVNSDSRWDGCECLELPSQQWLLAAHMWCLQRILEPYNEIVTGLEDLGELNFGDGYKLHLDCKHHLWTQGRQHYHNNFCHKRSDLIQCITKENIMKGP